MMLLMKNGQTVIIIILIGVIHIYKNGHTNPSGSKIEFFLGPNQSVTKSSWIVYFQRLP